MKTIPVKKNGGWEYALVDDADFEKLSSSKWYLMPNGYAARMTTIWIPSEKRKTSRTELMHRIVLPDAEEVDHENRNKLDNRRANLRPLGHGQNQVNRPSYVETASGFRGVFKNSVSKDGRIHWKGMYRTVHLGSGYGDDVKIALAHKYDLHALADIGRSADLNFPIAGV